MGGMAATMIMGAAFWAYLSEVDRDKPAHFSEETPLHTANGLIADHAIHEESIQDNPDMHRAAENGDAESQYRLGLAIVQRSWERGEPFAMLDAVAWIRKAADQNHVRAQCLLGALYEKGRGLIQDYELAHEWYLRAAQQGDAVAMSRLGMLFARGRGVDQNLAQAYVWLNLASARGDHGAESERNKLHGLLSATELDEAQKRSRTLDDTLPRIVIKSQTLPIGF